MMMIIILTATTVQHIKEQENNRIVSYRIFIINIDNTIELKLLLIVGTVTIIIMIVVVDIIAYNRK
jgi:hypothetical protein